MHPSRQRPPAIPDAHVRGERLLQRFTATLDMWLRVWIRLRLPLLGVWPLGPTNLSYALLPSHQHLFSSTAIAADRATITSTFATAALTTSIATTSVTATVASAAAAAAAAAAATGTTGAITTSCSG